MSPEKEGKIGSSLEAKVKSHIDNIEKYLSSRVYDFILSNYNSESLAKKREAVVKIDLYSTALLYGIAASSLVTAYLLRDHYFGRTFFGLIGLSGAIVGSGSAYDSFIMATNRVGKNCRKLSALGLMDQYFETTLMLEALPYENRKEMRKTKKAYENSISQVIKMNEKNAESQKKALTDFFYQINHRLKTRPEEFF